MRQYVFDHSGGNGGRMCKIKGQYKEGFIVTMVTKGSKATTMGQIAKASTWKDKIIGGGKRGFYSSLSLQFYVILLRF